MIEEFKSLYGFAWVVKDGGSTSRYSLLFFLQSGKTFFLVREKWLDS